MSNAKNWRPCKNWSVFSFLKPSKVISSSSLEVGQLITKSPRYKSLKKIDNMKLEGVWFQDEYVPFAIWDFHHKGVKSMSNVRTILRVVLHSFVQLEAHRMWSCMMPWIQGREKSFDQNQLSDECVKILVHWSTWM